MGHESFVCSSGWLARLKARYNLTTKVVSGEGAALDKNSRGLASGKLQDILWEYAPEDVFNMKKSALFFNMLPNRMLAFKEKPAWVVSSRRRDYWLHLRSIWQGMKSCHSLLFARPRNRDASRVDEFPQACCIATAPRLG